ncbi:MAG: serine hydroxymethyltransferase [Patescibacteria group bacterium]|nr:serine hydroxymethyltransferase [Patescibacteria group bacterium]
MSLKQTDTKIYNLIQKEKQRQEEKLVMIASENYTSKAVREALGSVLTHKYSEGEPDRRYYQGNEFVDEIEKLTNSRALKVFGLSEKNWHVNCKANSASIANLTVLTALLNPGDKILAMDLTHGGHLSHGWKLPSGKPIAFSAKIFNVGFYGVDKKTGIFNYQKIAALAKKIKPKLLITGGTAYARDINYKKMAQIAKAVGAYYLADIAHEAGLIAGKVLNSPFPYADVVTTSTQKTLRGPRGAIIICRQSLKDKIDRALFPGLMGGPSDNVIAAIGVCLKEVGTAQFKKYARQTIKNAKVLATELKKYGFHIVSGGTDKHLILVDLRKTISSSNKAGRGKFSPEDCLSEASSAVENLSRPAAPLNGAEAAKLLDRAGIVCNKNTVPFETGSPMKPSGIRLGTPALTTRGMKEKEMKQIAKWIKEILIEKKSPTVVLREVKKMTKKFKIK